MASTWAPSMPLTEAGGLGFASRSSAGAAAEAVADAAPAFESTEMLGRGDQVRIRSANARHEYVSKMRYGLAAELLQILPFSEQAMHQSESALRGAAFDGRDQFIQNLRRHDSEQFSNLRFCDRGAAICT